MRKQNSQLSVRFEINKKKKKKKKKPLSDGRKCSKNLAIFFMEISLIMTARRKLFPPRKVARPRSRARVKFEIIELT